MLLIKALEGTYKQKDIFDNGSEILSLFNTSGIEYHVDMEFIEHCKNWDKASFAKLNKNPKFTSAYQKHYKTSKALTLVWLNAILKNPEEITDFEDNVAILDRIITHDKTKPEEEVLPIPDLTIEESIEEIPSIESEEDIFTVSQIDESGFEGLEEVHETEEVPSFAPVEPTIPVESEDIFSPVITREEIEGLTSKENKTEESDVVQPEPFEFISSEALKKLKNLKWKPVLTFKIYKMRTSILKKMKFKK